MTGEQFTDAKVAGMVRMLMRDQIDHEMICILARDRIMALSTRVDELTRANAELTEERDKAQARNGELAHLLKLAREHWSEAQNRLSDFEREGIDANGGSQCGISDSFQILTAAADSLRADLATANATIAGLRAEVDQLGCQLEFDRTAVADCITKANKELGSRHWLTHTRGSYEWDDGKYQEEFLAAGLAIKAAIAPMTKIAANWVGCPMDGHAVAAARIDLQSRLIAAEAQSEARRVALELGSGLAKDACDPLWNKNNRFTDEEDALYTWANSDVPKLLATTPQLALEADRRRTRVECLREARAKMHRDQTWCQVADMLTDMAEESEAAQGAGEAGDGR